MCFGGGGKAPDIQQAPKATPRPTIEPAAESPSGQASDRAKRTRQYRSGFASTVKTGFTGVADETKKQTLGQ